MKKRHNLMMTAISMTVGLSLLTGCGSQNTNNTVQSGVTSQAENENTIPQSNAEMMAVSYDDEDYYTQWQDGTYTTIKLEGDTATIEGTGAVYNEGTLTITKSGNYIIDGKLSEGSLVIDSEDKEAVRVILNGVSIHSSTTAPFNVKNAEKVIISLEEGTTNTFSDGTNYVIEDEAANEPDSTIFSKDDLTINGTGTLNVEANYNNGITSKDDLKIMEGTINVTAVNNGIKGKDMAAIKDGVFTINAGGDGIKATNDTDVEKGFVNIESGIFDITAGGDGIQGETNVQIIDGQFNILTNGGSANGKTHAAESFGGGMGNKGQRPTDAGTIVPPDAGGTPPTGIEMTEPAKDSKAASSSSDATETVSNKGIKAQNSIIITGGKIALNTADDSIHSNNNVVISGGNLTIESGDDGIHSDTTLEISGGQIEITKSYEGIESTNITLSGGDISVIASDDGINVGGGNDGSAMGRPGANAFSNEGTATNMLTISGGNIIVDAAGDGLDSNGSITMTGGSVFVNGPTSGANGALDYDREFLMSGGTLIAAGSSAMLQATSSNSEQSALVMTFSSGMQQAGTVINVQDTDGNTVISCAPEKSFQSVVISTPAILKDKTYTVSYGGSDSGTLVDSIYSGGIYSGGTSIGEFTVSDTLTYLCETGITTAPQGGMGHGGGGMGKGNRGNKPNGSTTDTTQASSGI